MSETQPILYTAPCNQGLLQS